MRESQTGEKTCRQGEVSGQPPALAELRARARQLLQSQRDRIRRVERTLTGQLQMLWEELQSERLATSQLKAEHSLEKEHLEHRYVEAEEARKAAENLLSQSREALAVASGERQRLEAERALCQQQLLSKTQEIDQLRKQIADLPKKSGLREEDSRELARCAAENKLLQARLADAEARRAQAEADFQARQEDLRQHLEVEKALNGQFQMLCEALQSERSATSQLKAEYLLEKEHLEHRYVEADGARKAAENSLSQSREAFAAASGERQRLEAERALSQQQLLSKTQEIDQLRKQIADFPKKSGLREEDSRELARCAAENKLLQARLADAEARRAQAEADFQARQEDLRQHLEVEKALNGQFQMLCEALQSERSATSQLKAEYSLEKEHLEHRYVEADGARKAAENLLSQSREALAVASGERQRLEAERALSQQQLISKTQEIDQLRQQIADLPKKSGLREEDSRELARLAAENHLLQARLADAETQRVQVVADFEAKQDDLRRHFEMAVQENRELKAQKIELERQASSPPSRTSVAAPAGNGAFDWEAQKQRLMAQFDSDDSDAVALTAQEKLTVEGTIRITDQVVAAKEREIAELKKQTGAKGTSASREEALDRDEIIRGERENLRRLQEEWREKLRKAEVDISVERAKIARERLNLQEKLHAIEAERAELAAQQGDEQQADKSKPRSRNRWMARLGLKEDDA